MVLEPKQEELCPSHINRISATSNIQLWKLEYSGMKNKLNIAKTTAKKIEPQLFFKKTVNSVAYF